MAISDDERFKLRYGPYKTPRFKYGKKVQDEWRGEVNAHSETPAPPDPRRNQKSREVKFSCVIRRFGDTMSQAEPSP
jgi:hypothetical protein